MKHSSQKACSFLELLGLECCLVKNGYIHSKILPRVYEKFCTNQTDINPGQDIGKLAKIMAQSN